MSDQRELDGRYQLPLYVTEKQIIERMGVGINAGRKAVQKMRQHPRFPPVSIGGKRYWPSVVDFLDLWNGRGAGAGADLVKPDDAQAQIQTPRQRLGPDAPELERARLGYTDATGNFRRTVAGLPAGKIRVTAPDGRKWVDNAKPTDPASWQRKRPFKPRKPQGAN